MADSMSGRGFRICRSLAHLFQYEVLAIHTANLQVPLPAWRQAPLVRLRHSTRLALDRTMELTQRRFRRGGRHEEHGQEQFHIDTLIHLSDSVVLSYALADSAAGLLSCFLRLLQSTSHSGSVSKIHVSTSAWSSDDTLTWTMLYWLSGPEAPLRWLRSASSITAPGADFWKYSCAAPLGVSGFSATTAPDDTRFWWAEAYHNLVWWRHHQNSCKWPLWETPSQVVVDLRSFVSELRAAGWIP